MIRILLEEPVRFARGFASFIVEPLVRAPKARAYERHHNRFESSGDSPSAADSRKKASSFGRGLGSLSNSSQRSSSNCESSRSLLSTARRSASLNFESSLMISDALTGKIITSVGNLSGYHLPFKRRSHDPKCAHCSAFAGRLRFIRQATLF